MMTAIARYRDAIVAVLTALALAGASSPSCAAPAAPAAPAVEFLRDFTIAIPPGGKMAVRLVVPPLSEAVLDKIGQSAPLFAVGPNNAVWFGIDPGVLIHATKGYQFRPGVPLSDIAVLDGGGLLVATDNALGFIVAEVATGAAPGDALVTVTLQPITTLPIEEARLSAGANGSLYLYGQAREGRRNDVFVMAPEPVGDEPGAPRAVRMLRKIFSTTEKIRAVAGDGDETFVATGRLVVKLSAASSKGMVPVLLHPKEEIVGLARTRNGLLFYATMSGVGVVSRDGAVDFVKAGNVAIRSVGDVLYILQKNSFAVIKVEGTDAFRVARRPNPPKP